MQPTFLQLHASSSDLRHRGAALPGMRQPVRPSWEPVPFEKQPLGENDRTILSFVGRIKVCNSLILCDIVINKVEKWIFLGTINIYKVEFISTGGEAEIYSLGNLQVLNLPPHLLINLSFLQSKLL